MSEDLVFGAKLVPDFSQLESELEDGDFQAEVDMSGDAGGAGGGVAAGGAGGGKGKGGMLGMLGGIASTLTAVLGVVAILSQLEIVTEFIGLIARILEIMLLPTLIVIMALLRPFIQLFLRMMPKYLDALKKVWGFVESLINVALDWLGKIVGGLTNIGSKIADMVSSFVSGIGKVIMAAFQWYISRVQKNIQMIVNVLNAVKGFVGSIVSGIANVVSTIIGLPGKIAEFIADVIPGVGDLASGGVNAIGNGFSAAKEFVTSPFGNGGGGGSGGSSGGDVTVEQMTVQGGPETSPNVAPDLSDEAKKEKTGRNASNSLNDRLTG